MTRAAIETPWIAGPLRRTGRRPRLVFGRMHEDWALEARVFPRGARVFAIASAGTTALRLAVRGDHVTAVDLNPAQVAYVERRLEGAPEEVGAADRFLALARRWLRPIWAREEELVAFLSLDDPREQERFWRRRLDGAALRAALAVALHRAVLGRLYAAPLVRALPRRFAAGVRERLEGGFARHPNRWNPFAWRLLLGRDPPGSPPFAAPAPGTVRAVHAEAAATLESCAPSSFDAFTLSNILDGAGAAHRDRLLAAVIRAAAPGAMVILRTLGEPADPGQASWAREDRALIWGGILVARVENGGLMPCSIS
jgi:S-adenosylmethionine:diacylglycerol 3-amino-3-carboxypropyl transferase